MATVYWLAHVSLIGFMLLCAYLGLEFSFYSLFFPRLTSRPALFLIPLLWISIEQLRGMMFSGFGWGLLGYTQYKNLTLIQIADITGVWGISYLLAMSNTALSQIFVLRRRTPWNNPAIVVPLLLAAIFYGYGAYCLHLNRQGPDITVSIVQGNIAQEIKWDPDYATAIIEKYRQLSIIAAEEKPDIIIWPETSVPGYLLDEPQLYSSVVELAQRLKTHLLVGSPREDYETRRYYNSVFLFSPDGHLQKFHDKIHLVPFGEYIPYKKILWFLADFPIADFSAGKKHTVFPLPAAGRPNTSFSVLICFEDLFPFLVKRFRDKGAQFLLTVTNEAWFKNSTEPPQHTAISVFRAIENRCWFIRCANTGVSCFIDPKGVIRKKVELSNKDVFVPGIATMRLKD
ncbi:MAG: apolipoprotein N-acyltransferase [Candidatus Omnitrophica bacterium]|nr:apolipoprotein N-acyltransferase [Candidatus Omnitrophota bacterium]